MNYPTPPIASPPAQPARRYVKRGGYMVCVDCQLAIDYCTCEAREPASSASDGADSDLARRVREARARGGR